jgi:glycosyltransferase involved in cell wall biosynthesis
LPSFEPNAQPRARVGVVLLTFNSAATVGRTVAAARQVTDRVLAVDSHSRDGTPELLRSLGCEVHQRPFANYADQRNWAIQLAASRFEWQLHLDADEVLDPPAIAAIRAALASEPGDVAFVFHRRTHFLGRPLNWGGASNWHLRLFRSGTARCEDRLYDQHFVADVPARRLPGRMEDLNVGDLAEWTARHNRWSSLEADELSRPGGAGGRLPARLSSDPRERRRFYKGAYYRAPALLRALALFCYRYVVQLGFLDGRAGFVYAALQTFWFRLLVDAKLWERERAWPGDTSR